VPPDGLVGNWPVAGRKDSGSGLYFSRSAGVNMFRSAAGYRPLVVGDSSCGPA